MKTLIVRLSIVTLTSFALIACGKGFEAKTFTDLAALPEAVQIREVGPEAPNAFSINKGKVEEQQLTFTDGKNTVPSDYKIVKGRLQIDNFNFKFDTKLKDMSIQGDLNFGVTPDSKPLAFTMHGLMKDHQSTQMELTDKNSLLSPVLKAMVTCTIDSCEDFVIDFAYLVEAEKSIYVVRVNNSSSVKDSIENFPVAEPKKETTSSDVKKEVPVAKAQDPLKLDVLKNEKIAPQFNVPSKSFPKLKPVSESKPKVVTKSAVAAPVQSAKVSSVARGAPPKPTFPARLKSMQETARKNSAAAKEAQDIKSKKLAVGKIRKANPVAPVKADPKKESPPASKAVTATATEEAPMTELTESEVEDADATDIKQLGDATLSADDIINMFPQLKAEKERANKELADKSGEVISPLLKNSPLLKPLGDQAAFSSPKILEVLTSLPAGVNQAVLTPLKNGRIKQSLQNGVNLAPLIAKLGPESGLKILHPGQNNFWGTTELVATVIRIGQWVRGNVGGDIHLDVADLSDRSGGLQFNSGGALIHKSHQHGIDVDLGYVFSSNNEKSRLRVASTKSSEFLIDKQWDLFHELFKQNIAQQIYVSGPVKKALCHYLKQTGQTADPEAVDFASRIAAVEGHDSHFHLRIKCGPEQKLCGKAPPITLRPCL